MPIIPIGTDNDMNRMAEIRGLLVSTACCNGRASFLSLPPALAAGVLWCPMCEHNIEHRFGERKSQAFIKALLEDLRDLEFLVENHCVEPDETRVEADQEKSDHAHHATG